jgi:hypothetical protein
MGHLTPQAESARRERRSSVFWGEQKAGANKRYAWGGGCFFPIPIARGRWPEVQHTTPVFKVTLVFITAIGIDRHRQHYQLTSLP